jgi:heptosyltransferase-1
VAGHPALDEVWSVPRIRLGKQRGTGDLQRVLQAVRRLRAEPFDLVIDLQGLLKSAVWVALARSNRKLGYDRTRELSYLALTERLTPFDPEAHAVWRNLNVARHLGAPVGSPRFRLGLTLPGDLGNLISSGIEPPLVIMHPGARWQTKLWPAAHWARLAEWLAPL